MGDLALSSFQYAPLADTSDGFRLVELQPGSFNDQIRLRIFHASLEDYKVDVDERLSLDQLQSTLHPLWEVRLTTDGEFMFKHTSGNSQWQRHHPDETVAKWKWQVPEEDVGAESGGNGKLRYEAVSYTWGLPVNPETAVVESNNVSGDAISQLSVVPLRDNLATALRNLRHERLPRTLWIDAICINQEDDAEKSIQVRRMGSIFQRAHRVIAFLGFGDETSGKALSTLSYLGLQVEFLTKGRRCRPPEAVEQDWYLRAVELPYDANTWDAIMSILRRTWFTRLWMIQEVRLANQRSIVQCGRDFIPLPLFRRGVRCLEGKAWLPREDVRLEVEQVTRMIKHYPGLPLSHLLDLARDRKCFDARDKVYGILELLPPNFKSLIRPTYTAPASQVYQDTVLAHIRHTHRLELIGSCYQQGRSIVAPSWVPDWSVALPVKIPCTPQFASGASRSHCHFEPPGTLEVVGVHSATVSHVSRPLLGGWQDALETIKGWQPGNMTSASYPTGESVGLAHAITLRMNRFKSRFPRRQPTTLDEWLEDVAQVGLVGDQPLDIPGKMRPHFARMIDYCSGRSYFQTEEGFVGLGPPDVSPGDVVAVLLGCNNPILLRPKAHGTYQVAGECFVYGLQDANAILGPLPKPWLVEVLPSSTLRNLYQFVNLETGKSTPEDPRLEPLLDWERLHHEPEEDDAEVYDYFRHKETSQVIDSDPRLLPEALDARGVALTRFSLV